MFLILSNPSELNLHGQSPVSAWLLEKLEDRPDLPTGKYAVFAVQRVADFEVAPDTYAVAGTADFPPGLFFAAYRDGTAEVVTPDGILSLRGTPPSPPDQAGSAS